jgi:hypothetical protein
MVEAAPDKGMNERLQRNQCQQTIHSTEVTQLEKWLAAD